jgi:glycosyltransferase involved in cell wall biosynthesis
VTGARPGCGPAASGWLPTVSVVIAAYTPGRWDELSDAVASVRAQTVPVLETIVAVDHHPGLLALAQDRLPGVTVIANTGTRGASATRNTGVASSHSDVVAFLDDDAIAGSTWLEMLLRHFADPRVVGAGGRVEPLWESGRPAWFPPEFDWAVGASYRGMPEHPGPVRNVWRYMMWVVL